ncbi:MAG TPA: fumarylacetoacetate hydrolase family protein [Acidimicrobiales bacterium]|nr:fumarylacetoacetate hydrolase family protein [Acidimicrobiales bacterium]
MKLARFTADGRPGLGAVIGDEVADLAAADAGLPTDVGGALAAGALGAMHRLVARAPRRPLSEVRLQAPIALPPAFLAVGLNYGDHIDESGVDRPEVPVIFNKQVTCVAGPFDPIEVPSVAPDRVDYEGELGVVIGTRCRAVPAEQAPEVVAGYVVVNDVSVRDWQFATPTWTMGKGWDSHGPTGPWLVTSDELTDPHQLRLRTWVDGDLRQEASTADMLFDCWELIAHLTTAFTLLPGTIIATGTPAGVGYAMAPPRMLRPGSQVRVEIDGIGAIDNPVIAQPR